MWHFTLWQVFYFILFFYFCQPNPPGLNYLVEVPREILIKYFNNFNCTFACLLKKKKILSIFLFYLNYITEVMLLEEIRVHEHFILIIVTKKITVFNNIMVLLKMFKKYTHTH